MNHWAITLIQLQFYSSAFN